MVVEMRNSNGTNFRPTRRNRLPLRAKNKDKTPRERMLADLARSRLTAKDAKRLGLELISSAKAKRVLKISKINLPDGYLIPYHDANGARIDGAFRWRSLAEYQQRDRKTGKQVLGPKYRQPTGTEPWVYKTPALPAELYRLLRFQPLPQILLHLPCTCGRDFRLIGLLWCHSDFTRISAFFDIA